MVMIAVLLAVVLVVLFWKQIYGWFESLWDNASDSLELPESDTADSSDEDVMVGPMPGRKRKAKKKPESLGE